MRLPLALALAAALLMGVPARAEDTRYILAPTLLQTDSAPDAFALSRDGEGREGPGADLAALHEAFRQAFEAAFPHGHRPLTVEDRLDPDTPTLLVVPRLSVVRLNQDTVAGTLDRLEAVVVGDITLMDPWSMTRLFAATRMAKRAVELSHDRSDAERREALETIFREAGKVWIQDCLQEISRNAHPFTLKARILPSQSGVRPKGGGGFWPFGRLEGVKASTFLMGPQGRTARVRDVFDHFSVVESTAKASMSLSPDDEYRATLVGGESAAERTEPRVLIRWKGPLPASPGPGMKKPLKPAGWCGLLGNYLSKNGGLRLLPLEDEEGLGAWTALADEVKAFSMRNKADDDNSQDVSALRARDLPDIVVELGLCNAYYGTTAGDAGSTDHRFQATWAVRWFARQGSGESADGLALPFFKGFEVQPGERTFRTRQGVRELDRSSRWFDLCRDGVIRLADKLRAGIRPLEAECRGLAQGEGRVKWQGPAPAPGTRLRWRRFQGAVKDASGRDLGGYFTRAEPLPEGELRRCDPGDEVSFVPGSTGPVVGVLPVEVPPGFLLQSDWVQARLAAHAAQAMPMNLLLLEAGAPLPVGLDEPYFLRLRVDTPTREAAEPLVKLGATWRLRLYGKTYDPAGEPLFKLGLTHSAPFPLGRPYEPGDAGSAGLRYQDSALEELFKRATNQGLTRAFH